MSAITTHVLDAARGTPAAGVPVRLERLDGSGYAEVAVARTDDDGRVRDLGPHRADPGTYRLRFDTGAYFAAGGRSGFFPEVCIVFTLADPDEHHHVPLLLSPYAYSTYKGS